MGPNTTPTCDPWYVQLPTTNKVAGRKGMVSRTQHVDSFRTYVDSPLWSLSVSLVLPVSVSVVPRMVDTSKSLEIKGSGLITYRLFLLISFDLIIQMIFKLSVMHANVMPAPRPPSSIVLGQAVSACHLSAETQQKSGSPRRWRPCWFEFGNFLVSVFRWLSLSGNWPNLLVNDWMLDSPTYEQEFTPCS